MHQEAIAAPTPLADPPICLSGVAACQSDVLPSDWGFVGEQRVVPGDAVLVKRGGGAVQVDDLPREEGATISFSPLAR